jgi:elongation factor P--(R)-beta-lysine ligase
MALIFIGRVSGRGRDKANIGRPIAKNEGRTMQEWWQPERFAARRGRLEQRGRMLEAVRGFFAARGFVEVETPALQASPGLEPHLRAFATTLHDPRCEPAERYLHTSPEFAMKKLLVAGLPRIWQLAHVFRDGEKSATHHP